MIKKLAFLSRKEFLWPVLMVTLLCVADFCTRLMIWSDATNRDLVRAPLALTVMTPPYQQIQFDELAATLQQPLSVVEPAEARPSKDNQTRQFGDVKLKLLAIYQERGFVAAVRVVRSEQSKAELLRVKQGEQIDELTISNIESHQISIEFAGETTTIQLFKPGSRQD